MTWEKRMDDKEQRQRRTEEAIAQGRAVVLEARYLLARSRQRFAELGIDPEKEHERLKAECGDEALERAGEKYRAFLDEVEAEVQRTIRHAQVRGGGGRHARMRPGRV